MFARPPNFKGAANADELQGAINRVMRAPMSFFETTPLGRIMNRFSKDIDTIDNLLGDALRMFSATLANILGAIILIAIVLPWFLIGVAAITLLYVWAAAFYRASARELKVCTVLYCTTSSLMMICLVAIGLGLALVAIFSLLRVLVWSGNYSSI